MKTKLCPGCFQPIQDNAVCPRCGFDIAAEAKKYPLALKAGTVLGGKYIVGRVLGEGGFGITYLAQDYKDKKTVALKEYFPDSLAVRSEGAALLPFTGEREEAFNYGKACFMEEAKTLAKFIGNESIVRVFSYFEENNTAYFVMEYVRGDSLLHVLVKRGGKLGFEETKRLILPVADALGEIHAQGIVHRDISPDNIILTEDGGVKLIDFGAARYSLGDRSRSLDVVLKHGYAPIEQYTRRGRQGPYTDVYALCATIYKMLTGKVPPEAIERMEEDMLVPPSALGVALPERAEDALMKGLEVQARDRYQSVAQFKRDFDVSESEDGAAVSSAPQPKPTAAPAAVQRQEDRLSSPKKTEKKQIPVKKLLIVGIPAAAVLIAAVIVLTTLLLNSGNKPRDNGAVSMAETEMIAETETPTDIFTETPTESEPETAADSEEITYAEEDFGDFTVQLPSNWTYEAENGGIYFYEAYVHGREDVGSTGYLCDIVGIEPQDSDTLRPNARFLGYAGELEYYVQFPMGIGVIEDETASEKMKVAFSQVDAFVDSVIMK